MKTTRFISLLCFMILTTVIYGYDFEVNSIYYNINSDATSVTVTYKTESYPSYSGSIVIPSTVTYNDTEYSVTSIGFKAFGSCSGLTSIIIPNSVTSIGLQAFYYCSGLTSVTIPNSVTSIGEGAFRGCSSLTSIDIPNSVTSIGYSAFYGCRGLTSVIIPNSVTGIGQNTFYNCSGLTSIVIPESVTTIEDQAFYGCNRLASITIGSGVTSISSSAFSKCYGLKSVTLNSNSLVSQRYGSSGLGSIFGSQVEEYILGDKITSIGSQAFYGCSKLTSITIPNSVTSIGYEAFYGTAWYNNQPDGLIYAGKVAYKYKGTMPSETNITLDEGTLGIAPLAFKDCTGLTSVTIPSNVTSIGESAFSGCSNLTSVTIPESVTSIEYHAFYNCSGLTSITIPENVTNIGRDAFYNTAWYNNQPDGLIYAGKVAYKYKGTMPSETHITIEEGTLGITEFAFSDCTGLTSITIPESVNSIGACAFSGCLGLTSVHIYDIAAWCNISFEDTNYDTPHRANPLVYAHHLFLNGQEVKDLVIPNTVTNIGYDVFNGCYGLTSVTIPESVTSIDNYAFNNCSGLTSVTIPNSVTSIGEYAFLNCSGLTSVHINDIAAWCNIEFATVEFNPLVYAHHLFLNGQEVKDLIIPNTVTSIGEYTFSGCIDLTSVTIPSSVTNIGSSAFQDCPLQTIINYGNKDIVDNTFSQATKQHAQLYVPEGTIWDYIYNTRWTQFYHIKEFASNADDIRNDAVYMIADQSGRNFPVYDRVTKSLKNVAYTLNLDDNDAGTCWQVIEDDGDTYLYNIGAGMYAEYDEENNLSLSKAPAAVDIKVTEDGTTINGKSVMLVANKSVAPVEAPKYILGDANGNGEVEIGDVTSVLTLMATPEATGYNNKAADANGNGEIEIGDVTTILTIMAGGGQ